MTMITYLKCRIQPNNFYKITDEVVTSSCRLFEEKMLAKDEFDVKLNGCTYQKNLLFLEFEVLFNRIGKYWRCIENLVLTKCGTVNNVSVVKEVTTSLLFLYHNLTQINDKEIVRNVLKSLNLFKKSIYKFAEMDDEVLNILTSEIITVEEEPMSQYFHSYIEIFHLTVLMESLCKTEHTEKTYESVILDLMKLSYIIYEKHKQDVLHVQPFPCLCVRNLWIYIMKHTSYSIFWTLFNNSIIKENEEFCVWLIKHISWLQYYIVTESTENWFLKEEDINIAFVNEILEVVVSKKPNDLKLLNILKLLSSLLLELWIDFIPLDPYQILWDYFYKNINNQFQSKDLPKHVDDFMQSVDNKIINLNSDMNSYTFFLHLLYKYLDKHPLQWRKLQGRIYSRIPAQKIQEFSTTAIYSVSLLFFTVGSLKRKEVLEKLNSILENLSSNQQRLELIWILHINMVITYIRQNQDITIIAKTLQTLVQNSSENREDFHLLKHFVDGLNIIFNVSDDNLDLGQNCLFGYWIKPYSSTCSHAELCSLLELLNKFLRKAVVLDKWDNFKPTFLQFVLPALKQISVTICSPKIGELAGLILLNSPDAISDLISYFCNDMINVEVAHAFLSTVLLNSPVGSIAINQESMLISTWCRISILCTNIKDKELCKKIFNLQTIRNVIIIEEDTFNEPFVSFVKVLSKQMSIQAKIFRLKELCGLCFGNIDRWIPSYLTPATPESQVLHLFTKISLLFYYCTPLFYQKSKSFCLLSRLVALLLLPKDVLMGKIPSSNLMHAIEKTWHLFVKGINKLDYASDPYIDRTLKDLIIRYLPHFSTNDCPIMNILDNDEITAYVLEKITNSFLLHSARSSEGNTYKALKLIENILQSSTDLFKVKSIIQKVFPGVLEVIMFNSQKSIALNIIKFLTLSEFYNHIHIDIQVAIKNITEKHLAFNTNKYFQLIDVLKQYLFEDIRVCFAFIKEQIIRVERMRGVGFDNTLRQALNRIESYTV